MLAVAIGGIVLLVLLAVLAGLADDSSQDQAWRRIAAARRRLWEERHGVRQPWACPSANCPLRHYLNGQDT
jgi:hypothetical protein